MEAGKLDDLPPDVFVRGFIRSYAKSIGISSSEPLGLLDQVLSERRRSAELPILAPRMNRMNNRLAVEKPLMAEMAVEDDGQTPRRGIGLAVFVIIVLLIATITLSLFLRQQPQSGEGLSLEDGAASSLCVASRHT
jgi:cytoskeletal protein RodZ